MISLPPSLSPVSPYTFSFSHFSLMPGSSLQRLLSSQLLLMPWLPAFLARQRLSTKALELLHLDRALSSLGVDQLSDAEVEEVRYVEV